MRIVCPDCGSEDIKKLEILFESGNSQYSPPAKPNYTLGSGCLFVLLSFIFPLLVVGYLIGSKQIPEFSIIILAILFVIAVVAVERDLKNRSYDLEDSYYTRLDIYEKTWRCSRCGRKWFQEIE